MFSLHSMNVLHPDCAQFYSFQEAAVSYCFIHAATQIGNFNSSNASPSCLQHKRLSYMSVKLSTVINMKKARLAAVSRVALQYALHER